MARKQEVFGVTVEGDISGLRKAMNDAVREFKSTERALKEVNKAVELDPTDTKMLEQQRDVYKKAIQENEEALKKLKKIRDDIVKDPNFKKGITDMSEKFQKVNREIKEVTKAGEDLRKKLKALPDDNIAKINDKFKKLEESVKKSKDAIEKIQKSLKNVNDQIKLDPTNLELYTKRTTLLNDELRATEFAIRNIQKRQESLKNSEGFKANTHGVKEEWTQNALLLAQYQQRAKELRLELKQELSPAMSAFVNTMSKVGTKMREASEATKALSRAFQVLSVASIKSAIDYESSIANIRRVVSDLSDKTIQDLKDIAVETGNAFKDISDYATIGGALGLAEEDLSRFTKAMVDLNTATGGVFSGEEGAKGIAVFLKQLNLGIDQAENFGSAIAVIGDKYADIGDETVNVATRLTGLNSIIKTNQYELIGLAGVMADLGLATDSNANGINRAFIQIDKVIHGGVKNATEKLKEMADTAGMTSAQFKEAWGKNAVDTFLKFTDGLKSSVFNEINKAIDTSSEKVQKYADVLGLSAEQFTRIWGEDSSKVFDKYIEALGEMSDEGEVASKVLSDLGISSVNTAQTLLRLAGNGNEVRKAIELTEKAWRENTALTEKSGVIYETTASKLKGMWESIKQLGDSLGSTLLPEIKNFTDFVNDLVKNFNKLDPQLRSLIAKFMVLGASFSPLNKATGIFLENLGKVLKFFKLLGGVETLTLIAVLGSLYKALGQYEQFQKYAEGLERVKTETNSLNQSLLESASLADQQYRLREQEIDQYRVEAEEIDYLIEKLNKEKLSYEERAEIKKKIKEYVEQLNEALGAEIFTFDKATGKIRAQGEEIDTVRGKFAELAAELKKETWLDAHKGVLEEAYSNLDRSSSVLESATRTYIEQAKDIPQGIQDVMSEYKGNLDAFKAYLEANQIEVGQYSDEQLKSWTDMWTVFKDATDNAHTTIDNAQAVVDGYMEVADSTVDTLDENINAVTESINIMQEGVSMTQQSLEQLKAERDAYYQTLTEEQQTNDILLQKYDEQIAKLEKQVAYEDRKKLLAEGTLESVREYIRLNDEWQPQDKVQNIRVNYIGLRDLGLSGYSAGSYISMNSRGYGDLLKGTMDSVRNSLGNYRSGGYKSGGITVNANFTVNSNNVGRNDVRNWSSWIIDDINEALGKQM